MKVIITGGKGSLAQYLIKYLQDKHGDNIKILTTARTEDDIIHGKYIYDKNKVTFYICDVFDTSKLIWEHKPDYFVNLAAISNSVSQDKENLFKSNTEAVRHQLDMIRNYSKHTRYLNAGSSEEANGIGYYAESKREAHELVVKYRNEHNIFAIQPIIHNFTSELQKDRFILPKIVREAYRIAGEIKSNKKVTPMEIGNTRVTKSFLWADEVAESLWNEIGQEDKLFRGFLSDANIQSEESISLKNIIEQCFLLFDIWGVWSNNCKELNNAIDDVFVTYLYKTGEKIRVEKLVEVNPKFCRENEKTVEYTREMSSSMGNILEKLKNSLTFP